GQYKRARDFFEAMKVPVLAIPGNHDIPLYDVLTRFLHPYRLYRRYFGDCEFRRVIKGVAFVGLDATSRFLHTRGRLDPVHADEALTAARQAAGPQGLVMVA